MIDLRLKMNEWKEFFDLITSDLDRCRERRNLTLSSEKT